MLQRMLKGGVIEPSTSPWSSPIVLAKKKDGSFRFCMDFRRVNKVTKRDVHPLPRKRLVVHFDRLKPYLEKSTPHQQLETLSESPPSTVPDLEDNDLQCTTYYYPYRHGWD